jgi:hypothetical protein
VGFVGNRHQFERLAENETLIKFNEATLAQAVVVAKSCMVADALANEASVSSMNSFVGLRSMSLRILEDSDLLST